MASAILSPFMLFTIFSEETFSESNSSQRALTQQMDSKIRGNHNKRGVMLTGTACAPRGECKSREGVPLHTRVPPHRLEKS